MKAGITWMLALVAVNWSIVEIANRSHAKYELARFTVVSRPIFREDDERFSELLSLLDAPNESRSGEEPDGFYIGFAAGAADTKRGLLRRFREASFIDIFDGAPFTVAATPGKQSGPSSSKEFGPTLEQPDPDRFFLAWSSVAADERAASNFLRYIQDWDNRTNKTRDLYPGLKSTARDDHLFSLALRRQCLVNIPRLLASRAKFERSFHAYARHLETFRDLGARASRTDGVVRLPVNFWRVANGLGQELRSANMQFDVDLRWFRRDSTCFSRNAPLQSEPSCDDLPFSNTHCSFSPLWVTTQMEILVRSVHALLDKCGKSFGDRDRMHKIIYDVPVSTEPEPRDGLDSDPFINRKGWREFATLTDGLCGPAAP